MEQAKWYFDVISPFAYLHYHRMAPLRERLQIQAVPVLFAGLLKHWGTKGPAEVPAKRLHSYQYCVWAAGQQHIPFRMPDRHPFNSLAAQRLLVALGPSDDAVRSAFDFIYGEGRDPEVDFAGLGQRLGAANAVVQAARSEVKQQLVVNTQSAIDAGIFGVPTLVLRDRLFWGSDTTDWALQFLHAPDMFDAPEYVAAASSEFGAKRA